MIEWFEIEHIHDLRSEFGVVRNVAFFNSCQSINISAYLLFVESYSGKLNNLYLSAQRTLALMPSSEAVGEGDCPLAQVETPNYLQRFTYEGPENQRYFFDEAFIDAAQRHLDDIDVQIAKRGMAQTDLGIPPPKRLSTNSGGASIAEHALVGSDPSLVVATPGDDVDLSLLSPNASPRPEAPEVHSYERDVPVTSQYILQKMTAVTRAFQELPVGLHRFQLYQLFKTCDRSTLSAMLQELEPALRCDILSRLPPEIAGLVLAHLGYKDLCAAAQVCRSWNKLVESNDQVWRNLLEADGLCIPQNDMSPERIRQDPYREHEASRMVLDNEKNALGVPINYFKASYKAIYCRRAFRNKNWFNPRARPRRIQIPCQDQEVITCLDFDEDRIIVGSDGNKQISVYDTFSGALLHSFTEHDGGVWALKRVGKDVLVSGSTDHTVRVWDLSKKKCTHVFRGHTATVRCLDVIMPVASKDAQGQTRYVPERPVVVTGSRDATLRMWNLPQKGDPEWFSPDNYSQSEPDPFFIRTLMGHTNPVRAVSGYANTIVSGSYDKTVRVWDLTTGECRWELVGHTQNVYAAVIDPERDRCISASMDSHVNIWDLKTGTLIYSLAGHTSLVGLLGLCPPTLVSAAADKTLRVWNPDNGQLLHKLVGHDSAITCFQHDRFRVVSGSERHVKLWDIRTGRFVRDLLTGLDHIWQVGFNDRWCVAAVTRGQTTFIEVLDFDSDSSDSPSEVTSSL